ncbi:MAG: hypothetical protein ACI4PG_03230 [Candidatus Ventricola sp.]
MKRFVCIVVALVCCASVAVAAPSKSTGNMSSSTTAPVTETVLPAPSVEVEGRNAAHTALCTDEVAKLQESGSVEAYFGDVKDEAGNSVSLASMLGTDDVKVNEFVPLTVSNYEESYGKVRATFKLPTAYANGEKVAVMIGIPNAATGEIEWVVLEGVGVGTDGEIQVEFTPALLVAIQNSNALMAVASK